MAGHEVTARPDEGTNGRLLRGRTPFRMLGLGIGLAAAVMLAAGAIVGILLLEPSLLGAGIGAHLDNLRVTRDTASVGLSDLSLGGLARAIGVSAAVANVLPAAGLVVGVVRTWLLRGRAGLAFVSAGATLVLGSPVVNINSYALLLA